MNNLISFFAGEQGSGKTFMLKKGIIENLLKGVFDNTNNVILVSEENYSDYDDIMYAVMNSEDESLNGMVIEVTNKTADIPSITVHLCEKRVVLIKMPSFSDVSAEKTANTIKYCLEICNILISRNSLLGKETDLIIDSVNDIIHSGEKNRKLLTELLKNRNCNSILTVRNGLSEFTDYDDMKELYSLVSFEYTSLCEAEEELYKNTAKGFDEPILKIDIENEDPNEKRRIAFFKGYKEYLISQNIRESYLHSSPVIKTKRDVKGKGFTFGEAGQGKAFTVDIGED